MNKIHPAFARQLDTAFTSATTAFNRGVPAMDALVGAAKQAGLTGHGAMRLTERFNTARALSLRKQDKLATFDPTSPDDVATLVTAPDAAHKGAAARVHAAHAFYERADKAAAAQSQGRAPLVHQDDVCALPAFTGAGPCIDHQTVRETRKLAEDLGSMRQQLMTQAQRTAEKAAALICSSRDAGVSGLTTLLCLRPQEEAGAKFAMEALCAAVPPTVLAMAEKSAGAVVDFVDDRPIAQVLVALKQAAATYDQAVAAGIDSAEAYKLAADFHGMLQPATGAAASDESAIDWLLKQGGAEADAPDDKKKPPEPKVPSHTKPVADATQHLYRLASNHLGDVRKGITAQTKARTAKEWDGTSRGLADTARQIAVQRLISTDPMLAGADPERLRSVLDTLYRFSPHILDDQEVVRAVLRQGVNTQAVGPFDAKSFADLDKAIAPPQPKPGPEAPEGDKKAPDKAPGKEQARLPAWVTG